MLDGTDWRRTLGKWSGIAFLVAGVSVSIAAIAMAVVLVTDMSPGMITGLPTMVGLLISYLGMFGLYPILAARNRRAALAGIVFLLFPVIGIGFWLGHDLVVGQMPPYVNLLIGLISGGFVIGLALYGITSYRLQVPSQRVGLALLALAVPWVVLLGSGIVYGGNAPAWLDFVATSMMGGLLLVIGYLTWTESSMTTPEEPTPDPAA
jgi:hypothetical protein